MFTRPDSGDCPISYPCPTYSAVKGIFEAILWGPDIEIIPRKVQLCKPVQYHTYCTNYGGPLRSSKSINSGDNYQLLATVLVDVSYRFFADVVINRNKSNLSEKALNWDRKTTSPGHAYQAIFQRRLKRGQCFSIPSLGWKEFTPSYFGEFRETTEVQRGMPRIVIPSILRQVFSEGYASPVSYTFDQDVVIEGGELVFPR